LLLSSSCSAPPRSLPSFPTRRSSDLDFRPDYLFIRTALSDLGSPQVLAMTATATPEMMHEVAAQLGRDPCAVNTGVAVAVIASTDRKSTRLNSSHSQISYAVFCLKKK